MFVSTKAGEIPFSKITSAVVRRDDVLINHAEGITTTTPTIWEMALKDTPIQMVSAEFGTYALHPYFEDGVFAVARSRVIAWSISADRFTYPVTTEGMNDGVNDTVAILHPDGSVDIPCDRTFATYDEWATAAKEELRAKATPKAA